MKLAWRNIHLRERASPQLRHPGANDSGIVKGDSVIFWLPRSCIAGTSPVTRSPVTCPAKPTPMSGAFRMTKVK